MRRAIIVTVCATLLGCLEREPDDYTTSIDLMLNVEVSKPAEFHFSTTANPDSVLNLYVDTSRVLKYPMFSMYFDDRFIENDTARANRMVLDTVLNYWLVSEGDTIALGDRISLGEWTLDWYVHEDEWPFSPTTYCASYDYEIDITDSLIEAHRPKAADF